MDRLAPTSRVMNVLVSALVLAVSLSLWCVGLSFDFSAGVSGARLTNCVSFELRVLPMCATQQPACRIGLDEKAMWNS